MISPPASAYIGEFSELQFKPGTWHKYGVPERGCRIRNSMFPALLQNGGMLSPDRAIHGLMDWLDVTDDPAPARDTLRRLLDRHYPPDNRESGRCRFEDENGVVQVFHAGRVEIEQPLVAWQRREWILAVAQPAAEPGRLIVGARAPISLNVARSVLAHSMLSYMGDPYDSFVGVQTSAGRTGAVYAWDQGRVTPIRWDDGLDDEARTSFRASDHPWLAPNQIAVQVAIANDF